MINYAYCHYDGYISHNGKILNEHYRDPAKVKELLSEGDLSSLGETIDKSVFYHRDRKEDLHINLPIFLEEFATNDIFNFRYLLRKDLDGSWNWYLVDYLYGEVKFTSLTSLLANHA